MKTSEYLHIIEQWARQERAIWGVMLVGSHARNEARPDSDIDLILFTEQPEKYIADTSWSDRFGIPSSKTIENWGMLTAIRTFFADDTEIEFGITSSRWIALPLDEGSKQVMLDGHKILYDPSGQLTAISNGLRS